MTSTSDTIKAYGDAWNETDAAARRALLERVWAEDAVYCDPVGRAEGREALVAHIGAVMAQMPGYNLELVSDVDEHDGQFRFLWELHGADGALITAGIDFGTLSADGKIQSITGFFGPPPPLP